MSQRQPCRIEIHFQKAIIFGHIRSLIVGHIDPSIVVDLKYRFGKNNLFNCRYCINDRIDSQHAAVFVSGVNVYCAVLFWGLIDCNLNKNVVQSHQYCRCISGYKSVQRNRTMENELIVPDIVLIHVLADFTEQIQARIIKVFQENHSYQRLQLAALETHNVVVLSRPEICHYSRVVVEYCH